MPLRPVAHDLTDLFMNRPPLIPSTRALAALALVALALFGGCSMLGLTKPPEPLPPVVPKPVLIENPGRRVLWVGDEQAGATIVLAQSQELSVRLPLVATLGLDWRIAEMQPGVLSLAGPPRFERALHDTNADEAAGDSIWLFKPLAPGTVTLQFELKRPRTLEPVQRSLTYTVTVK